MGFKEILIKAIPGGGWVDMPVGDVSFTTQTQGYCPYRDNGICAVSKPVQGKPCDSPGASLVGGECKLYPNGIIDICDTDYGTQQFGID